MNNNILDEYVYIKSLYSEYMNLIDFYKNINRSSIFCRYYNINNIASNFDQSSKATFDIYNSGLQFDIYDLTPLYISNQLTNDYQVVEDFKGLMLDAQTTITTYTIKKPRLNDLIIFDLPNNNTKEIFRVSSISSSISGMNTSNDKVTWHNLTLEYAPIENTSKLNILNKYVYDLATEKYIERNHFEIMIKENDKIQLLFKLFEKEYFDNRKECYFYLDEENNSRIYPLKENKYIFDILANKKKYRDFFPKIKRPYRYKDFCYDYQLNNKILSTVIKVDKILDWNIDRVPNIFEMCYLLKKWIWNCENNIDKYDMGTDLNGNVEVELTYDHSSLVE